MLVDDSWGLILIVVGARILVPSAAEIGHRIGVPEDVIAATMVEPLAHPCQSS